MNGVDLVFVICLAVGAVAGLIRGWWRCFIGIVVLVGLCIVAYLGFFEYAWMWVQYDSLQWLSETFKFSLTFNVPDTDISFRLTNLRDAFILLQNVGLDPVLLGATSDGFAQATVGALGFVGLLIASFIVSTVAYWILLKWLMPKRLRKGIIARLLGAILGAIEMGGICIIFLQFTGNITIPLHNVVIPQLLDNSSELNQLLINSKFVTQDMLNSYVPLIDNVVQYLNPLSANSQLVRPIVENLGNLGFSPFNIISVEVLNENGDKVKEPFKDAFADMLNNFIETGVGKLNTLVGA